MHLALKTLMVGSVSSISASEGMIVLRRAGAEVGVDGKLMGFLRYFQADRYATGSALS